jgi:nicotinamide mononucleotide transporter
VEFFSAETVMLDLWGYPLSWLEFCGTLLALCSVLLVARGSILTWPFGTAAQVMLGALLFQKQLYSDVLEQGFFFTAGLWGWWLWARRGTADDEPQVSYCRLPMRLLLPVIVAAGTAVLGWLALNSHRWWPQLFEQPAAFPWLDAFTTALSFTAYVLMARRRVESWYLWIVVDILGISIYFARHTLFLSLLYGILLFIAVRGLINWHAMAKRQPPAMESL